MRLGALALAVAIGLGAAWSSAAATATVTPASQPQSAPQPAPAPAEAKADSSQSLTAYERESLAVDRAANGIGKRANSIADAQRVYGLLQLILGVFAVGFTGFAAIFAWRATVWARKAAEETERGAGAAEDSLRATREGERRQLRAYVHVSGARLEVSGASTRAVVLFKNFGLTPASDVVVECLGSVRDYPLTEALPVIIPNPIASRVDLPPGGDPHNITLDFAEWDDPPGRHGQGGTALYVFGIITYRDAFKRKRETRFRMFRRSSTPGDMSAAHEGNRST